MRIFSHFVPVLSALAAFAAPVALCSFVPSAAHAFNDCTDVSYLERFPVADAGRSILCVEHFRVPISTASGPRQIRAISDVAAGWAVPDQLIADLRAGAEAAARALPRYPGAQMDDVTFLIIEDRYEGDEDNPDILGITNGMEGVSGPGLPECLITIYGLRGGAADQWDVTAAHELFHCVQHASLTTAQNRTYGRGGDWWIEGSAENFAAIAVSGSQAQTGGGAAFAAAVDAGTPLYQMRHEAVPFFHWLSDQRGPSGVMTFMRAMARSPGAAAQRAAMRGALSDDAWLEFAQDVIMDDVQHPQGGAVGTGININETLTITGPGPYRFTIEPFTIHWNTVDYDCGTWGNEISPSGANISLRRENARDWEDWPEEVDVRDGQPGTYWMAAMRTGDGNRRVTDRVEHRRACQQCGPSDEIDQCLAGVWQMSGGGPVEWMRRQGLPTVQMQDGPRYMTFLSNGLYSAEPVTQEMSHQDDDTRIEASGGTSPAFGRWSAKDGEVHVCTDAGGVSGSMTITTPDFSTTQPVVKPGAGHIKMRYSCGDTSMQTTMTMPRGGPMTTNFSKIGKDPLEKEETP